MKRLNAILATLPAIEIMLARALGVRSVEIILDIDEKDLENEGLQEPPEAGLHHTGNV